MVAHYHQALNGLLIAFLLFWGGEASAQVTWPNEPAGATVLNDWGWGSCPGGGWQGATSCGTIASDATAPLSPSSVLRYTCTPPSSCAAGDPYIEFQETHEFYIGIWAKPSSPFQGYANLHNKIWVVFLADGSTIWLEMISGTQQGGPYQIALTLTFADTSINNCHLPGWGDCPGPYNVLPNASSGVVTLGSWNQIEVYLKSSSSPSTTDGIMRVWLNGTLAINVEDARTPSAGAVTLFNGSMWDGSPDASRTNVDVWSFDHVHVSALSCGAQGCPQPIPAWPNEPTGASTLLDWAFNTVAGSGLTDASGRGTIVSDATAQLSPVNVLRSRLQNGIAPGGVTLQYDLADLSEVFAGAWWKPNTTFQGDSNSLNHMMWFQKSGTPVAVGRVTWFGTSNAAGLSGSIQFHINDVDSSFNNCHLTGWVGNCPGPGRLTPNMSSCTVAATDDQWHRLEVYVRRSTSTTNRTGIVRWWLDGNLCGNYDPQAGTGVNWGPAGFDYWAWNEEWTTTPITQSADWIHYIDHLYISQPTGATTVDTMPPGPVTNFGVTTGGPPPPDPPPVGVSPGAEWFQFF